MQLIGGWSMNTSVSEVATFPKTHRNVLSKIIIDLLYFWDVYDVSLREKKFPQKYGLFMQNKYLYINVIILRQK